jgi:hypothetical protein
MPSLCIPSDVFYILHEVVADLQSSEFDIVVK